MTRSSTFLTQPVARSVAHGDEALWFPVHSSVNDNYSRPVQPDGSARPAPETAITDDSIGLPSPRQPRKGGKGPKSRGPAGFRYGWLWIGLAGVAVVAAGATLARKGIAEQVAQNWLAGQGVHARVKLDHLSLGDAAGTVIVGDPQKPEFSIGHFEANYHLNLFAGGGQPLARVTRLKLVDPLVAFSYRKGKLRFGSLDKLVQSALTAPPSNSPPPEDIVIEGAQLVIDSDYGTVRGKGALSLHAGQLIQMVMDVPATRFNGPMGSGDLDAAHISAKSVNDGHNGDQLHIQVHLDGDHWVLRDSADAVEQVAAGHERLNVSGARVDIDGLVPYRHTKSTLDAFSGRASATLSMAADRLALPGTVVDAAQAALRFDGELKSANTGSAITGVAQVTASAAGVQSGAMTGKAVQIAGDTLQLEGHFEGQGNRVLLNGGLNGDLAAFSQPGLTARDAHVRLSSLSLTSDASGLNAGFRGDLTAAGFAAGDLALDQLRLILEGTAQANQGDWTVVVKGDLASDQGHYSGMHAVAQGRKPAPSGKDAPVDGVVALDRAFDRFSLRARGIGLTVSGDASGAPARLNVTARTPLVANLTGGGTLTITPKSGTLYSNQTPAALDVNLSGGGLPVVALGVSQFKAGANGGFAGAFNLTADISADPVTGAHISGHGAFRSTPDGVFSVTADGPVAFTAKSAELGDHVETITGSLTQTGPNLLMLSPAGWRIGGNFHALSFTAPTEQAKFSGGEGAFSAYSIAHSDALGFKATLTTSTLGDALPADQTRFKPLTLTGAMEQDAKALNGHFFAAAPLAGKSSVRIAAIDLNNVTAPIPDKMGRGSLAVHTLDLTFAPGGLQPGDLSPMAETLFGRNTAGKASFDGAFHWAGTQATSGGTLKIAGLDYTGATGVTHNLHGQIDFTSLAPLESAPGQKVQIENMMLGLPLSNLDVSLHFGGERLSVERASVDTPGGPVTLEPLDIAFDGKTPIASAVNFNGLDFGKVVAATDLAKSLTFEGTVTGHLPFSIENGHVRLSQGEMSSDAPGRISVFRQAVTGVQASGSMSSDAPAGADSKANAQVAAKDATDPAFNPFQDLAFQAMEHVSFDKIDAKLNSQGPILDVNFHIKGRFDPPQKQKATVSLFDYISGKWMQKPIKLPSGTPIELFLEVPFNSDDLTSNIAALNALVGSK